MKDFNLTGINDNQRWALLQKYSEIERQKSEHLMKEQSALQRDLLSGQIRFGVECQEQVAAFNRPMAAVISLVRAELDLPFDEAAYVEVLELSSKKQAAHLEKFLRDLAAIDSELDTDKT